MCQNISKITNNQAGVVHFTIVWSVGLLESTMGTDGMSLMGPRCPSRIMGWRHASLVQHYWRHKNNLQSYTVFIRIEAPGAKTKFLTGCHFSKISKDQFLIGAAHDKDLRLWTSDSKSCNILWHFYHPKVFIQYIR